MAYISKQLATIKTDCEINFKLEDCEYSFPFLQKVKDFFDEWDFRSLSNRKDIFDAGVRSSKVEAKKIAFEDLEQVRTFSKSIKNCFCYDLKNLQFEFIEICKFSDFNKFIFRQNTLCSIYFFYIQIFFLVLHFTPLKIVYPKKKKP